MFLTKHTAAPHKGPNKKDAMSAGSSDTSISIKDGINGTLNANIINTDATADSMAAVTIFTKKVCFLLTVLDGCITLLLLPVFHASGKQETPIL
jgi:hypothetical protein